MEYTRLKLKYSSTLRRKIIVVFDPHIYTYTPFNLFVRSAFAAFIVSLLLCLNLLLLLLFLCCILFARFTKYKQTYYNIKFTIWVEGKKKNRTAHE